MATISSVDEVLGTRLAQTFWGRLKDWSEELQKSPGATIVAISRKGPRLVELMVREGFLSESVLSHVIAEQALPFLTQNENAGFVVIDDAMTFGTTLSHVFELTKQANIRCGGDGSKLMGIPFAVGQEASKKHRELVTKYFLDLKPEQIAPFVYNEMLAFRLLGKPYDIEHPMLTWTGDFTDSYELETALGQISKSLDGQIFNIDTFVPTATGNVPIRRWTILLPNDSRYNSYPRAGFRKLRIYLNPEKGRLLVAAMCPLSLSKADMDSFGEILPEPLNHLWSEAVGKIDTQATEDMTVAGSYSLAMWANFLFSVVLLRDVKPAFLEAFENTMLQPQMLGPRREDLQYLIGTDLCFRAESGIAHFLECADVDSIPASYPLYDHAGEIVEEKVPPRYVENYTNKRSSLIDKALEVNDVLQAIFYAQHSEIELISRDDNKNNSNDNKRLEFGITYGKLRQTVLDKFPYAAEIDIHECLDKLIDNGAVVPRYLNMASADKSVIWVRTFRVGESTVMRMAHTICLLFGKLSNAMGKTELPPLVFEKFCTLALCVATDVDVLKPLRSPEIIKSFHLYGARPAIKLGKSSLFLTDWAVSQNILCRSKTTTFTEENGSYSLHKNIEKLYPERECHWDDDVKAGLNDLAKLVAAIHERYHNPVLVALTSVVSIQELQRALEAELQLWLYDRSASVYKGLAELSLLVENMITSTPTQKRLDDVNNVLSKTANFTAQFEIKIKLKDNLTDIYRQIDELVAEDNKDQTVMERFWHKLHMTLNGRSNSESYSPGLQEIISALNIAHTTTRILRELLTMAGFKDKRSKGLEESLNLLQAKLDDPNNIDRVTRKMFTDVNSELDIATLITIARDQPLDDLQKAFPAVRKLVLEIADRCEHVLQTYKIDQQNEQPDILMPPRYIMMWDIIGSTNQESRDKIESLIVDANRRIFSTLGKNILGFHPESKDDGNGFICDHFTDAIAVFQILNEVFRDYRFRAGCEVNLQGQLNYYPESKSLGGRAYEYAARVMNFYKEIKNIEKNPDLWSGDPNLSEPTENSYMVVSEFAKRYAEQEKAWPKNEKYKVKELTGTYKARVNASLPVSIAILQPVTSQSSGLDKTETHREQLELI